MWRDFPLPLRGRWLRCFLVGAVLIGAVSVGIAGASFVRACERARTACGPCPGPQLGPAVQIYRQDY